MPIVVTAQVPATPDALTALCEGFCGLNFQMMRFARDHGGGFPSLYESGIIYRPEARAGTLPERWQTAVDLLRTGVGDCEDLVFYRVGELRCDGELALPEIGRTRRGTFHARVRRANGRLEDPSRILLELEGLEPHHLR